MALGYFTTDISKDKQYNKLLVCTKFATFIFMFVLTFLFEEKI